ncbi:PQQ-binding-like beta-propeller repeat protein [bacterium]|nr:PQQ-binding-like beta-propeller repeat protein [bacterium]
MNLVASMFVRSGRTAAVAMAAVVMSLAASAQTPETPQKHPGRTVYEQKCAACHNVPEITRAPAIGALQGLAADTIRFVLTEGIMKTQGATLTPAEFTDVVAYLAAPPAAEGWAEAMMCPPSERGVRLSARRHFTSYGVDAASSRRLRARDAGLRTRDFATLDVDWAIGFPQTTNLRSSPVIVGRTMFYTSPTTRKLLAIDTRSGCAKWVYDHDTGLRTSITLAPLGRGGPLALFTVDARGRLLALDPANGDVHYLVDARHDPGVLVTGAPVVSGDRVIVPISAGDAGSAADDKFECCKAHGAVAALDARTGARLWTWHATEDAKPLGRNNRAGTPMWGPSGVPVWSTPTVDEKRGVVYVTTGENNSLPATETSDAVIALDLATGKPKWIFQALARDVWTIACGGRTPGANCPDPEDSVRLDYDFGAGVLIAKTRAGKEILLAGQKSGDVFALDPDNGGKVIWRRTLGSGSALGGVHWGLASDGTRVFVGLNDPVFTGSERLERKPEPGLFALDITTGETVWSWIAEPACADGRQARFPGCAARYGVSAAPLVVDGAVVAALADGRVYAFDARSGAEVWSHDTLRDYNSRNTISAKGGSIDSHSIFAGDGALFIGSGYGQFGQPAGNALLAFRLGQPDAKR